MNILSRVAKKGTNKTRSLEKDFWHKQTDKFNKVQITGEDSKVTLTNNGQKDIVKVIKSLQNGGILFKGATKKLLVNKENFSIVLGQ